MASQGYVMILIFTLFISILQVQSDPQMSRRDLSSLISSVLDQKSSGSKRPIVVILSSGSNKRDRNSKQKYLIDDETSDELGVNVPHIFLKKQKAKTRLPIKMRTTKSLLQLKQRDRQLHQLHKRVDDQSLQRDKNSLRSPIIKKLLRISNRLQCDAKDDCEDKCNNKYKGKKVITCQVKCEEKYDCVEEEKEKDDCGEDCVDSCGNEAECLMSTKGERIVPEENKCKRC